MATQLRLHGGAKTTLRQLQDDSMATVWRFFGTKTTPRRLNDNGNSMETQWRLHGGALAWSSISLFSELSLAAQNPSCIGPYLGLSDADRQDAHEALLRRLASNQMMLRELDLLLETCERILQVVLLRLHTKSSS